MRATYILGLESKRHEKEKITTVPHVCVGERETDCQTLLNRIAGGDSQALSHLFRRYSRLVHNVGQRILRDKAEADDLVQEVFLYIHRKSTLFDSSKGSTRSWIVQVAYTQALLRRRHLKAQGFYLSGITDKPIECDQASNKEAHYDHTVEGLFGRRPCSVKKHGLLGVCLSMLVSSEFTHRIWPLIKPMGVESSCLGFWRATFSRTFQSSIVGTKHEDYLPEMRFATTPRKMPTTVQKENRCIIEVSGAAVGAIFIARQKLNAETVHKRSYVPQVPIGDCSFIGRNQRDK